MKALVAAVSMTAALFAAAVQADSSMRVDAAGLNLDTPAGVNELLTRIAAAAHVVCDAWETAGDLASRRTCISKAVKAAVKQINRPQLTLVAENFRP